MNLRTTTFAAAAAIALAASAAFAFTAHGTPQPTVKLERVVVVGKAAQADTQVVAQLPRVIVTGYSEATLLRNAQLAAAKTGTQHS